MIPSYFVQIDKIPLNPNGKLDRKKLPEPEITPGERYEAPGNEVEEKLVEIWAEVLNIDRTSIGVNDNFFELGGHSLTATVVMSRIHNMFNVRMTLSELFTRPFIRQLAQYIKEAARYQYLSIEPVEKKPHYALSSAQKRLYILQQANVDDMTYNMPLMRILKGKPDKERLAEAFQRLIERHEGFRTSLFMVEGTPVQKVHEKVEFEVEHYDHHFVRPFDLSNAPLLRVGLVKLGQEKHLLMIDMHHIISDGTSMKVFINDFLALYANPGEALLPLRLQYKDFSGWQHSKKGREVVKAQEGYWRLQFQDDVPELKLTYDYPVPVERDSRGNRFDFQLTLEETGELKQVAQEEEVTLFMLLLAIYVVLLHKLSWSEDIVVGTPVMAREHAELHPIIGMFVNTLALRNYPSGDKTFKAFLKEIKQNTMQAFENQAYPFEQLVEKVTTDSLFSTMFALQNLDIPQVEIPGLTLTPYDYKHPVSRFDLTLIGVEEDEILCFEIEYRTGLFKEATIERFADYFREIINIVSHNKEIKLEDIDIAPGFSDSEETVYEEASGDFGF
jgi:acyl carrier protein